MRFLNRRNFLQDSAALAAAMAAGVTTSALAEEKPAKKGPANDQLRVAVVGVNSRGMSHVGGFAAKNNCIVTTICDCDEAVIGKAMKTVEERQGKAPKFEQDIRK